MCVTRHDVDEGRHSKQASKEGRKGKNSERVSKCLHPHAKDAWHQGRRFLFRKERERERSRGQHHMHSGRRGALAGASDDKCLHASWSPGPSSEKALAAPRTGGKRGGIAQGLHY